MILRNSIVCRSSRYSREVFEIVNRMTRQWRSITTFGIWSDWRSIILSGRSYRIVCLNITISSRRERRRSGLRSLPNQGDVRGFQARSPRHVDLVSGRAAVARGSDRAAWPLPRERHGGCCAGKPIVTRLTGSTPSIGSNS